MQSVDKTAKFQTNPSFKLFNRKKPDSKNEKSFDRAKKPVETNIQNEQNSILSTSRKKILAIVTLNIEDESEKLIIYEGQDIYELASSTSKKYKLGSDFTNYITKNINIQIQAHQTAKKKQQIALNSTNCRIEDSYTPKFKRSNNFNNLNSSKSREKECKSTRQNTTSPLKKNKIFNKIYNDEIIKPTKLKNTNYLNTSKNFSTNSKLVSSKDNESFNESIRQIKNSVSREKKTRQSPANANTKNRKLLVSKNLKIIENNIIFLPPAFLCQKPHDSKKDNSMLKMKSIIFYKRFLS